MQTATLFPLARRSSRQALLVLLVLIALDARPVMAAQGTFQAATSTLGVIPDGPSCPASGLPRSVIVPVSGLPGRVVSVSVTFTIAHPTVGDLRVVLRAPTSSGQTLFTRTGAIAPGDPADASDLAGQYTFSNTASGDWWAAARAVSDNAVVPPGAYRASNGGTATAIGPAFVGAPANGVWAVDFFDDCGGGTGAVTAVSLTVVADGVLTPATPGSSGPIPDGGVCGISPTTPKDVLFPVGGVTRPLGSVSVMVDLTHSYVGDLRVTLIAPTGASHVIFGRTGAVGGGATDSSNLAGRYEFSDATSNANWWTAAAAQPDAGIITPGRYRTSQMGGLPTSSSTPTLMDPVFAGIDANGTWVLRIEDACAGDTGTVVGASLELSAPPAPATAVPDAYVTPVNGTLIVAAPGVLQNDINSAGADWVQTTLIAQSPAHGTLQAFANGSFTYAPTAGYLGLDTFAYRMSNVGGLSNTATVTIAVGGTAPVAQDDHYTTSYVTPLVIGGNGVLGNDVALTTPLSAQLLGPPANGTLTFNPDGTFTYTPRAGFAGTDTFTYRASNVVGPSAPATVSVVVAQPTSPQPGSGLVVTRVSGQTVTLRWNAPVLGPAPTGYVLEGGIAPGQALALVPTGLDVPTFTFTAPAGSFYVRMRTQGGGGLSAPTNEVPIHVVVPVTPSTPANLLGTAQGTALTLAWQNTFGGGEPANLALDVTGPVTGSVPLPGSSESFAVPQVPAGTYTFRVRAMNAGGSSAASAPVTLTFAPGGACTGAPATPRNLLVYRIGSTVWFVWDPPAAGAAPSGYVLDVASAVFTGQLPIAARQLSAPVPAGSYTVRVAAANGCGTSAFTAAQTVVVP